MDNIDSARALADRWVKDNLIGVSPRAADQLARSLADFLAEREHQTALEGLHAVTFLFDADGFAVVEASDLVRELGELAERVVVDGDICKDKRGAPTEPAPAPEETQGPDGSVTRTAGEGTVGVVAAVQR